MTSINVESTKSSPAIVFDPEQNALSVSGDSYPENSFVFFKPLVDFLVEFSKSGGKLTLNIELNYFNSSTSKVLFDVFDLLEQYRSEGNEVKVNWYCESGNEFIRDEGEEFALDYPELIRIEIK